MGISLKAGPVFDTPFFAVMIDDDTSCLRFTLFSVGLSRYTGLFYFQCVGVIVGC